MIFNKSNKKQLEKELKEKQEKLAEIEAAEKKAKTEAKRKARREKVARQQKKYKNKKFGLSKPASERLLLLMLHISQATNPYDWIKKNVRQKDNYDLAGIFAKIDSLEQKDGKN